MLRDNLFSVAKDNIDDAQLKQKRDYDRKRGVHNKKVSILLNANGMVGHAQARCIHTIA